VQYLWATGGHAINRLPAGHEESEELPSWQRQHQQQ